MTAGTGMEKEKMLARLRLRLAAIRMNENMAQEEPCAESARTQRARERLLAEAEALGQAIRFLEDKYPEDAVSEERGLPLIRGTLALKVDPTRVLADPDAGTGIYIRAQNTDGRYVNADLVELDKASVLVWLRSRGGGNRWAEDVVGLLLGHGHLHPIEGEGTKE